MDSGGTTNLDRIREYRQRLQREPNPLAYALLAEAFREESMLSEAEEVCRQGLEAYQGYVTTRIILAQILEERGDPPGAYQEFEGALVQDPDNVIARTAVGRLLIQQGRMDEAAQHLEQVLFMNPADLSARELLNVAQGRQELPAREVVKVFVPPAAEGARMGAAPAGLSPPPSPAVRGLASAREGQGILQ